MANLYDILGVPARADQEEVKNAYRKLARECHPDLNPDPAANDRMAEINAAFEVLSDPVRRSAYDASLGLSANMAEPNSGVVRRPTAVQARVIHRHRAHNTPVYGLSFSHKDGAMASVSFDNELLIWSPDLATVDHRYKLEGGVVSDVQYCRDGKVIAAGSTEQSLSAWTLREGRIKGWRQTPKEWVVTTAPSPDARYLAVGTTGHEARLLNAYNGDELRLLRHHRESVTSLAWSEDAKILSTGSADASVAIWDPSTGYVTNVLDRIRSSVTAMTISADRRFLAVAAVDLSIRVFSIKDEDLVVTFHGHTKPVESLSFHPRGWLLASASRDGTVGLWNIERGLGHGQIEASHQPLLTVGFHPSGRLLASAGLDKVVRVWSMTAE